MTIIVSPLPNHITDVQAWFRYDSHNPTYHLSHRQIEHFYSEKLNLLDDEIKSRFVMN